MRRARISAENRHQQILAVATDLFARQGFAGTTTRQVAERAGVTEALIFRHFPRKQDLYWAVLEYKCRATDRHAQLRGMLRNGPGDEAVFASIAEDILRRNTEDTTLGRLLLFSALEQHKLSQRFFRTHIAESYEILARYIRERIRKGEFRRVDPLLAARGFLGMVVYHFLIQELFGAKHQQQFDIRKTSEVLARIWLDGMQTRNGRGLRRIQSRARRLS